MEQGKDMQRTEGLSKFLDNQIIKTSPFADNRMGERIYKRVEKIAAASILVSNHMPIKDPLRTRVRMVATELITASLAMRDDMRSNNSENVRAFKSTVRELISLIKLLAVAGEVSIPNADAIAEALDELTGFLATSQRSTLSESVSFTKEDLADTRDISVTPRREHVARTERPTKPASQDTQIVVKDIKITPMNAQSSRDSVPTNGLALTARSQVILEVLRAGGTFSIGDIAAHVPEYSEKMIQRELANLASLGKVAKQGEKRWSRYRFLG